MKKLLLLTILFAITRIYASADKGIVSHMVLPHETLFKISLMYNSTVDDIVHANPGLKPNGVRSGLTIKVPKGTKLRDSAFVADFLKTPSACKLQEIPVKSADENPFMRASGQGKSMDQMIQKPAPADAVSQNPSQPGNTPQKNTSDTEPQQYSSEDMQSRYLKLKDLADHDKNVKVIDMSRIKISTETATVQK